MEGASPRLLRTCRERTRDDLGRPRHKGKPYPSARRGSKERSASLPQQRRDLHHGTPSLLLLSAMRPADLRAAAGRTVPDLGHPGLRVLLVGINPSLWSGATGLHFANPSNRLWPVLALAGWTPRRLDPSETGALLAAGIGITNLVGRATARADELTDEEVRRGLPAVEALAARWQPGHVAFLGLGAYRTATGDRRAGVGPLTRSVGGRPAWLLPNPSGLNAGWQLPRLVDAYRALRHAA